MNGIQQELRNGFETAYINRVFPSNLAYRPEFISNNPEKGKKVLSSLEAELQKCEKFQISVAFITMGGITPLLQTLKELEERNIPGEILTTDYLTFSEPKALDKLSHFKNITLRMYRTEEAEEGFHTKGYIFKKEEIYRIIIGSSNTTSAALTRNREWNQKIVSTECGEAAGENRALLISATGTGKTYASAFAMRELGFARVLFLVHRNELAKQAKKSYEHVFDSSISMGILGWRGLTCFK